MARAFAEDRVTFAVNPQNGYWSARWGNWVVGLRSRGDTWDAKVWRWPPDTALSNRVEINSREGFKTSDEAVSWACDVMVADGAKVFALDAPPGFALKCVLEFRSAPEVVN